MTVLAATCTDISQFELLKKAGADEAILALENGCFSALETFAADAIIAASHEAHETGLTVTVLMNRLFSEEDIFSFTNQTEWLIDEGIDRIIVSDPGLLYAAKKKGLQDHLIFDPLTLITNAPEAQLYKDLGLSSVTISQLLTKEEIMHISSQVPGCSLCVFGHQLMSVSASPLLSAYEKRKNLPSLINNRHLFLREEKREDRMPAFENEYAAMIYSDYILDSFDEIEAFEDAGIQRMEFHGEFLSEEILLDAVHTANRILNKEPEAKDDFRNKYSGKPLTDGYYGIKTIK